MESMKKSITVGWMCAIAATSLATTLRTTPQRVSSDLAYILNEYSQANAGSIPDSWKQLDDFIIKTEQLKNPAPKERSFMFESFDSILKRRVEDYFVFLPSGSVKMAKHGKDDFFAGGAIISTGTEPVKGDRRNEMGRYVVWQDAGGRIRSNWLEEAVIKAQFAEAGVELPTGPPRVQPPTFEVEATRVASEYAEKNFRDPNAPTPEEIEKFRIYLGEKYSDSPVGSERDETAESSRSHSGKSKPEPASSEQKLRPKSGISSLAVLAGIAIFCVAALAFRIYMRRP